MAFIPKVYVHAHKPILSMHTVSASSDWFFNLGTMEPTVPGTKPPFYLARHFLGKNHSSKYNIITLFYRIMQIYN